MIKVTIIGYGNVAQHLITAFQENTNVQLVQVYSRSVPKSSLINFNLVHNLHDLIDADVYIIAVVDDAIESISEQLNFKNKLVVHTSGSASIDKIHSKNRAGVFYPLQTFTKNKAVNFRSIPLCLEAQFSEDYFVLQILAKSISDKAFAINSNQRKALHVAAVFVNNFTNHMFNIGEDICNENQIPFEILRPLIQETVNKIEYLTPNEAQTGPAIRKDLETINAHLKFLKHSNYKEIYQIITQSIQNNVKKL